VVAALAVAAALAQQKQPPPKVQEPAEEDEDLIPKKDYTFNPLQAKKEFGVGNFYFKKGNFKGAAIRFREATRWDPTFAEAFLRLGAAEERAKDRTAARQAYAKFIELAPDDKRVAELRKKLDGKP